MFKAKSQDIKAILFLTLGIFLSIALGTYHPMDPSLNSLGNPLSGIHNRCGYVGSFLSDILYQLLGIHAWFLVLALFHGGITSFLQAKRKRTLPPYRGLGALALIISLSGLLDLYFPGQQLFSYPILLSGLLGHNLANGLRSLFNPLGAQILLWGLILIFWLLRGNRLAQLLNYGVSLGIYGGIKLHKVLPQRLSLYSTQPLVQRLRKWQQLLWNLSQGEHGEQAGHANNAQ